MAIYGTLGEVDLGALEASIADTAVDIFVYDTTKDSDGGAWRKRTQHTSWYNETLNTTTRGSRREFPAVAVIVAETRKLTIYDGDDPDLPMWMVFNKNTPANGVNTGNLISGYGPDRNLSCVVAKNSSIILGESQSGAGVLYIISMIADNSDWVTENPDYGGFYNGSIVQRHDALGYSVYAQSGAGERTIVSMPVNDVAMTVLPNAPIDSSTGLPTPTIAVATNGGVSVIKDDGSVVSGGEANSSWKVNKIFIDSYYNIWGVEGSDYSPGIQLISTLPYSSVADIGTGTLGYQLTTQVTTAFGRNTSWPFILGPYGSFQNEHAAGKEYIFNGATLGLTFLQDNTTNRSSSMVAYASTSYNTGWMHGDIKGAFLSDTDDTNVTSSNLMSGATYNVSDRITSYSYTNGSDTLVIDDDEATADGYVALTLGGLSPSTKYVISYTSDNTYTPTTGYNPFMGNTSDGTSYFDTAQTGSGQGSMTFTTASSGDPSLVLYSNYSGGNLTYTIQLRLAEEDRSVNDNGLAVYGTITKSAVATGAELVGYSGYSASNYLIQPSISAPGTGDFSVSAWIKPGSADGTGGNYLHLFSLGTSSTGGQSSSTGFVLKFAAYSGANSNGFVPYFYNNDGGTNHGTYDANNYLPLGVWGHIVATRKNGVPYIYLNGELVKTGSAWTTNLTDTYATVFLGLSQTNETGGEADVSLLRYSLSAPSAAQIKKMYEDEKVLFQENAACTLYGSSDAVTALAYDPTTSLLHVGTSSGRSEFKGLRRVDNTTTAVTTAISASSGLVAEQ